MHNTSSPMLQPTPLRSSPAQSGATTTTSQTTMGTPSMPQQPRKKEDAFGSLLGGFGTQTPAASLSLAEQQRLQATRQPQAVRSAMPPGGTNSFYTPTSAAAGGMSPLLPLASSPGQPAGAPPSGNRSNTSGAGFTHTAKTPGSAGDVFGNLLAGTTLAKSQAETSAHTPLSQLRSANSSSGLGASANSRNGSATILSAATAPATVTSRTMPSSARATTTTTTTTTTADNWNFDAFLQPSSSSSPAASSPADLLAGGTALFHAPSSVPTATNTAPSSAAGGTSTLITAYEEDPLGLFGGGVIPPVNISKPPPTATATTSVSGQAPTSNPTTPSKTTNPSPTTHAIPLFDTNFGSPASAPVTTATSAAVSSKSKPTSTPLKPTSPPLADGEDSLVARMVDIGFSVGESKDALRANGNNLEAAVEYLMVQKQLQQPASPSKGSSGNAAITEKLKGLGLNSKQAERAGKLMSNVGDFGMKYFQKAKTLVADTTKKVREQTNGDPRRPERRESDEQQRMEEQERSKYGSMLDGGRADDQGWNTAASSREDLAATVPIPAALPRKKQRTTPLVYATPSQLAECERLKEQGNVFFRQGQYGDAEETYSNAIQCLPAGHLFLLQLLNNRAAARLKTGQYTDCISDCTNVVTSYTAELDYEDVTQEKEQEYRDAISKALLRRANAYENVEKWEDAGRDYKTALEWNAGAKGAQDGILRCGKATTKAHKIESEDRKRTAEAVHVSILGASENHDLLFDPFAAATKKASAAGAAATSNDLSFLQSPSAAGNATAKPAMTVSTNAVSSSLASEQPEFKSERVEAMRQKDREQQEEEAAKLAVKDEIDAKLNAWSGGKKQNIRALLSSLETILWPEIRSDWKPVNLSELITPQQVKIRYMKAIGKLHPDKLSKMTLTADQQLIANGVFATMNEAWDAFKVQNNL